MSYSKNTYKFNANAKPRTNINKNKFCKVCYDACLSESEYTSHWVKDKPGKYGKIVCPYLLSLECRYCKEKGHTPKHCPKILLKNENYNNTPSINTNTITSIKKIEKKEPKKIENNIFNLLTNNDDDSVSESDYESDIEVNKKENKQIIKEININLNEIDYPSTLNSNYIKKNDICLNMDHCMSWADIMEEEDNRDNTAF